MTKSFRIGWKYALAGLFGIGGLSTAQAQQPPAPTPTAAVSPNQPGSVQQAPASTTIPFGELILSPSYVPVNAQTGQPTQPPPLPGSQPVPFQVAPGEAPAATNDQNFFAGNPPVQDLSGLLAGNFKNTKYKWYGFVRLDGIYDFRPMGSTDSFVTASIPVPQGRGQNSVLTPRYTRIGFDTETPLDLRDWTLKTRIEMDFFNGNTSGVFGSFPIRLRFAWADFGPFLIGQAASGFMDYDVFPNVLDYQGPGGMILMRQPIAALHTKIGEHGRIQVAIEQPYSDIQWFENGAWVVNPGSGIITTPGVARNVQDVPDVTANMRYAGDYGHVQIAGIARKLTYQPATGDSAFDELGYGINVTGTFHPWACCSCTPKSGECATPMSKSRFLAQYATGRGINRYFQDPNGLGLDATFDPLNGFRVLESTGWFLAYEHWWTDKLISNFTYGELDTELTDTLPANTFQSSNYITGNLIWLPTQRMGVGLEYLYGYRKNKDGQKGENTRIQMAFQYKF